MNSAVEFTLLGSSRDSPFISLKLFTSSVRACTRVVDSVIASREKQEPSKQ
jgi:hypothetical protein